MKLVLAALGCAASLLATAVAAQVDDSKSLEGLWLAQQRFGPDIRGTLTIIPRNGVLVADIAGFTVPVTEQRGTLSFELPDGKGSFRGTRDGRDIAGQWIQQPTVGGGARYATPIVLRSAGRGRWSGEVEPLDDHMTYYLPIARAADGRLATYLRNPERNQGVFFGVSRIEQDGDKMRLVGTRRGQKKESEIAVGTRDPDSGRFTFPLNGRTYDFDRDLADSSAFYPRLQAARPLHATRRRSSSTTAGRFRPSKRKGSTAPRSRRSSRN